MTPLALTHVGPILAVSLPMTMVQAASRDVRRLAVTERTLMRCGFGENKHYLYQVSYLMKENYENVIL